MGGLCSRSSDADKTSSRPNGHANPYSSTVGQSCRVSLNSQSSMTPPQVLGTTDKQFQEPKQKEEIFSETGRAAYASNQDELYDGIPRYTRALSQKSRSVRSRQAAVAKVSEVSSRIGRAGTLGIGKAVEVLDTLGSSMTNLQPSSGFASGSTTKGSELGILSFEVANTIVKGSNLMQSLSKRSIRHLKEVVLVSEGVQRLVSKDMDELIRIVSADKREEFNIFSSEVVRFGNRSKDPQWHNLDRYFEKVSREFTPQRQLKEEAESVMQHLMEQVQYTAELYHELHALDRLESDYQHKHQEVENVVASQKGDDISFLRAELKSQRKQVRNLKKKSLWSRSLEEVMEKLADIVHVLHLEIHSAFDGTDSNKAGKGLLDDYKKLGPAGLALHYANLVIQIDTLVARSSSMAPNSRDTLYQNLPPSMKLALRSKMRCFHVKEELNVTEIKAEMEKTLQWLVPIATNTAKAHHGFGWVGEWAGTGTEVNRKSSGQAEVIRIETFYHADKEKIEAYILEVVLWLHHLVSKFKAAPGVGTRSPIKSPIHSTLHSENQPGKDKAANVPPPVLTVDDKKLLEEVSITKRTRRISRSHDFDYPKIPFRRPERLSKSSSQSPARGSFKDIFALRKQSSVIPAIDFGIDKEKALDVIDRVDPGSLHSLACRQGRRS